MFILFVADFLQLSGQTLRPTSDIAAGSWTPSTGTDLYAMIDEAVADDADYIQSSTNPSADTARVKFGPGTTPTSRDGHVVSYRLDTNNCTTVTVNLYSGASLIKTWTHSSVASGITAYDQALTNLEATSIGDYTDLELEFSATA